MSSLSSQTPSLGKNRTGIATSREFAERMVEGTREFAAEAPTSKQEITLTREAFAKEAEPLGSVPLPNEIGGAVNAAIQGIKGAHHTQFIDKLGERLAFERSGVRLYEALISKYDAFGGFTDGPTREELERHMLQEYDHFRLLGDSIERLGGDPTVITPSADLQATMSRGVMDVMVDARTTLAQCLEALLVAELVDNDCWEDLVALADQNGEDELVASFGKALSEEEEHLESVRRWVAGAHGRRAG